MIEGFSFDFLLLSRTLLLLLSRTDGIETYMLQVYLLLLMP